jgi:sugar phosphate isomerase/epimerase
LGKRAVSTWSLHRTLGRFVAADSAPDGGRIFDSHPTAQGLDLLDLPAELRRHSYDIVQICHFHLPSRTPGYLDQLRAAMTDAGVELEALLIDAGDLSNPEVADHDEAWIGEWLETAVALGARRARICAGRSAPSAKTTKESAARLVRLAASHPGVRVITENWLEMTPNADAVLALLAATGDAVGLMVDLGNWRGPEKYAELARIAPIAETCHAKCHFTAAGPDVEDFRASLRALGSDFAGSLALIYDGPDDDEWAMLDVEQAIVREVFA